MKRILIFLFCVYALALFAETKQHVWHEGKLQYACSITQLDSVCCERVSGQEVRIVVPRVVKYDGYPQSVSAKRTQVISLLSDTLRFEESQETGVQSKRITLFLSSSNEVEP